MKNRKDLLKLWLPWIYFVLHTSRWIPSSTRFSSYGSWQTFSERSIRNPKTRCSTEIAAGMLPLLFLVGICTSSLLSAAAAAAAWWWSEQWKSCRLWLFSRSSQVVQAVTASHGSCCCRCFDPPSPLFPRRVSSNLGYLFLPHFIS